MTQLSAYLKDPTVTPKTPTCRIKAWAHDSAFTLFVGFGVSQIGWVATVLTCRH